MVRSLLWMLHDVVVRMAQRPARWVLGLPLSGDYEHAAWMGRQEDIKDLRALEAVAFSDAVMDAEIAEQERLAELGSHRGVCDACGQEAVVEVVTYPMGDVPWNTQDYAFCVDSDECVRNRKRFGTEATLMDRDQVAASLNRLRAEWAQAPKPTPILEAEGGCRQCGTQDTGRFRDGDSPYCIECEDIPF